MINFEQRMNWSELKDVRQLDEIASESTDNIVLIFKHSTRCSTSRVVLDRLQRNWREEEMTSVKPYFLDLLTHREISNRIADDYHVSHESPQVLMLHQNKSIYDQSHMGIDFTALRNLIKNRS